MKNDQVYLDLDLRLLGDRDLLRLSSLSAGGDRRLFEEADGRGASTGERDLLRLAGGGDARRVVSGGLRCLRGERDLLLSGSHVLSLSLILSPLLSSRCLSFLKSRRLAMDSSSCLPMGMNLTKGH